MTAAAADLAKPRLLALGRDHRVLVQRELAGMPSSVRFLAQRALKEPDHRSLNLEAAT